jgi:putative ABC transport system permease protein
MLKNYFKIAWRIITRYKVYTAINILGLALGICSCMVIYLIASYELGFDTFHRDKERIYRVMGDVTENTGEKLHFARLPFPLLANAHTELQGLDAITGIIPYNAKIMIPGKDGSPKHIDSRNGSKLFPTTAVAEPQYFDIFKYQWLAGNARTALTAPNTVVLTESKAQQYFGSVPLDQIIGKRIIYDDSLTVSVSGIVKDWNQNSDLAFTDFISFSTLQTSFFQANNNTGSWAQGDMSPWIFAKLADGITPAAMNAQMARIVKTHAASTIKLALWLEPLTAIHFNADVVENPIRTAHLPTLYALIAIALFILLLAVINFINLSTAQSFQRAKEVGVRKVLGSNRKNLVFQFLTETFVITVCSVILAVALVKPVLVMFHSFIPDGVSFRFSNPSVIVFLLVITIITSLFAGIYPATVLSSFLPALSLKGTPAATGNEKWLLRKGLIVFQFSVSLVFIISCIVITSQLKFTRQKDPGFTSDAIITIETPRGDSLSKIDLLSGQVKDIPAINKVALQWVSPMTENTRGMHLKFKSTDEKEIGATQVAGNENFIPLYGIKLLAGRNLLPSDSVNEFVISETLSRFMGDTNPSASIGKTLYWNNKPYPVVGVVADFHTRSFHDPITPLCIINRREREGTVAIKLSAAGNKTGTIKNTLVQVEKIYKQIYPSVSFTYHFYDESLALLYKKDQQSATLMNASMAITVFISCIGLFGLVLFTAGKRAKEISIRKILGAGVSGIAIMLGKDFFILVVCSFFIASPVAWYFMHQWLQSFAYRINISWWMFALAFAVAVVIALTTISFQAIKAAVANPVKSLRAE